MIDFWSLTPEQILHGIKIANNPSWVDPSDPMHQFVHDLMLQALADIWLDCNQDMTLMKLQNEDTINKLRMVYYSGIRVHGHA